VFRKEVSASETERPRCHLNGVGGAAARQRYDLISEAHSAGCPAARRANRVRSSFEVVSRKRAKAAGITESGTDSRSVERVYRTRGDHNGLRARLLCNQENQGADRPRNPYSSGATRVVCRGLSEAVSL